MQCGTDVSNQDNACCTAIVLKEGQFALGRMLAFKAPCTCATARGVTPCALARSKSAPLDSKICTAADLRCLIAAESAVVPASLQTVETRRCGGNRDVKVFVCKRT